MRKFSRDLVEPSAAFRSAVDLLRIVEAEGEQDRLLQPLMHDPLAVDLLGDAGLALVEEIESLLHGVAHHAFGL